MMGVIVMETVLTNEKDERFLELVRELDRGYYERIGDELSKYDQYNEFTKPHVVLLALDSGQPIACASYRVLDEDSVEFKRVYVKQAFRKRGIAYCLITELEKLVMKDEFSFSIIVTGAHNVPAIRLYEKLGYHMTDDFGQFIGDDSVICMRKEFM